MIFDRLADGIQKHAKVITALWVVMLIVMAFFALKSGEVMSYDINDMAPEDSESIKGLVIISEYFPDSETNVASAPILVIYYEDQAALLEGLGLIDALNVAAQTQEHISRFMPMDPTSPTGPGIIMALLEMKDTEGLDVVHYTSDLREFIAGVAKDTGFTGEEYLTGMVPISYDMEHNSLEDVAKIDPFTVLMILILVGLFFRSFVSSATPPLTIGFAFVVTMGLIFFLGHVFNIFFITNMMILVSMMGAGCDYCIFIIARYREELRSGKEHNEALHEAIVWAGESITISGASVIIGFGAISICDYSMISTMGICLALGILVALIAALTLIPSILQLIGDRIFWPTRMDAFKEGGKATRGWYAWCGKVGTAYFHRSAKFSLKHAKAIAVTAILITVPAVYVMSSSEDSYDMITAMLSGESGEGMEYIGEYADQGMVMPNYSVIEYRESIADVHASTGLGTLYWTEYWEQVKQSLQPLYTEILKDDNIAYIDSAFEWQDILDQVEAAGITDTDEKVAFVKSILSTTNTMYFEGILAYIDNISKIPGVNVDASILFDGMGPTIDAMVAQTGYVGFNWDQIVAQIKEAGVTDPDAVIATVEAQIASINPEMAEAFKVMIASLNALGINNEILVNGMVPAMDYIMNVTTDVMGGDYKETGSGGASYLRLSIATTEAAMSPRSMESISWIAECVNKYVAANEDIVVEKWNTGTAVIMYEVSETVKEQFTLIEILVVILIIILLFVVMRSYLIPLRSVLTILMSISWTLAITHLLFVDVLGHDVLWLVPIMLLVICLGLGMDYDILLTTRIKENVMARGMSNDDAIYHAVTHTGSVITICGLIMGGAFGTLMISGIPLMQEFGFALCFAILVDALIVRTYIVPAIMHILGDWNWKGPGVKRISSEDKQE